MIKIWNIISLIIYMILFLMISIIPIYAGSIFSFKDALRPSLRNTLIESYKKSFSSSSSTLFNDYFQTTLKKMSKVENECYSNRKILNESSIDCELLAQERIRLAIAYAQYDEKKGTVKTDNKTYQEIGVPLLIEKIPTHLTMGKAAFTAEICSPTTVV